MCDATKAGPHQEEKKGFSNTMDQSSSISTFRATVLPDVLAGPICRGLGACGYWEHWWQLRSLLGPQGWIQPFASEQTGQPHAHTTMAHTRNQELRFWGPKLRFWVTKHRDGLWAKCVPLLSTSVCRDTRCKANRGASVPGATCTSTSS